MQQQGRRIDLEPLELWEYVAVHPHLAGHYQLIYRVLWETGIRIQECLNLKKTDLENGGIWVNRLKKKKNERRDFIPVTAELYQSLQKWSAMRVGKLLFPYTPQCAWKALRKAAKEAGVRTTIHPHLFRHAFGRRVAKTDLKLTAMDQIAMLQQMLGHSSMRYTMTYFTPSKAEVQQVYRRLGGGK